MTSDQERTKLLDQLAEKDREIKKLQAEINDLAGKRSRARVDRKAGVQEDRNRHTGLLLKTNKDLLEQAKTLRELRQDIELSIAWRLTKPLRRSPKVAKFAEKAYRKAYRTLKKRPVPKTQPDALKILPEISLSISPPSPAGGVHDKLSYQKERLLLDLAQRGPRDPVVPDPDKYSPLISVLIPTYNTPESFLIDVVESVFNQTYSKWELCLCDDGSTDPITVALLKEIEKTDKRVRLKFMDKNSGIAAASQAASKLAQGEFVAIVDHDDILAPGALSAAVGALRASPDADLVYTDHAMMSKDGVILSMAPKREWSPEFFLSTSYIVHFKVIRKATFDKVGGFEGTSDLFSDGGLILKLVEADAKFAWAPGVQYFWRVHEGSTSDTAARKPKIIEQTLKTYNDYFKRKNIPAQSTCPPELSRFGQGIFKLEFPRQPVMKTAVVVVAKNPEGLSKGFAKGFRKTAVDEPPALHIFSLNGEIAAKDLPESTIHTVSTQQEFDAAVRGIDAEAIVFVDSSIRLSSPTWLTEIVGYLAVSSKVGACGGAILNQWLGMEGGGFRLLPGLPAMYKTEKADELGFWYENTLGSNVEAVSSLFMATPKRTYEEVGGLPVFDYGDGAGIAYGLKLKRAGCRSVYNPWAKAVLFRDMRLPPNLEGRLRSEFGPELFVDRYFHPSFDIEQVKGRCDG